MYRSRSIIPLTAGLALLLSGCAGMLGGKHEIVHDHGKYDYKDPRSYVGIYPVGWAQIVAVNGKRLHIGGGIPYSCGQIKKKHTNHDYIWGAPGHYRLRLRAFATRLVDDDPLACARSLAVRYDIAEINHEVSVEFHATAVSEPDLQRRKAQTTEQTYTLHQRYLVYFLMDATANAPRFYGVVTTKESDRIIASSDPSLIGLSANDPRFISRLPKDWRKGK